MSDSTILQEIVAHKRQEVARNKAAISVTVLEAEIQPESEMRPFEGALRDRISSQQPAVIAEIKKASPSKGLIRADFDPVSLATEYAFGGATCLSVLTDEKFFQGHNDYLRQARAACNLPVLRKDFIIDPYQIIESRWLGADCILLIVAALEKQQLAELSDCAQELGLDVLVEVHNKTELEASLELNTDLIGINNRDLHSFSTDLNTTYGLLPLIPEEKLVITESGINSRADIVAMQEHGVFGYLIGEIFMRSEKPGEKLREIVFNSD
ncbi:MAG: indole-3-glycerol phosphate synthase TrpC [Gammaproteobacteria bacterium]|nr:indole-3-glycerol phosphate synthase TrpC [Gammaproteobacteria bacterium]